MKSTVVDESLSSFKPMYCSREYQASTRLIQQYEKSTLSHQYVYINMRTHLVLRGDIDTCPNIEVEIDVTDKLPFFIRPYYVKEEDENILVREMKRLCYLGILKEAFSAYSSPFMLISRKVTKDKKS